MTVPLDPLLFLPGAVSKEMHNTDQRYTLLMLLLIAKQMITVNFSEVKNQQVSGHTDLSKSTNESGEGKIVLEDTWTSERVAVTELCITIK